MKQSVKSMVIPLMLSFFLIAAGCSGHTPDASTGAVSASIASTSAPTTGATTEETNGSTGTTVDVENVLEEQRVYLENQKALREDNSVAAKVNGDPIYQWQIETIMNENNQALKYYRMNLDTMNQSEEAKANLLEIYQSTLLLNKKDIMNDLIRDAVIQNEAGKRGLLISDEDALAAVKQVYENNVKKTPELYASAQMYMEVMNLSEDDYLRMGMEDYKKEMGQASLYQQITAGVDTDAEKKEAFNAAVDEGVHQADMTILNNQE